MFTIIKESIKTLLRDYTGMDWEVTVKPFSMSHTYIVVNLYNYMIPSQDLNEVFYQQIPAVVSDITGKDFDKMCEFCENPGILKQDNKWLCLIHTDLSKFI